MIKLRPDIKKGDIFSLVQYVILPIFRKDGIPLELNLVILHIYCTCKNSKTIFSAGYVFGRRNFAISPIKTQKKQEKCDYHFKIQVMNRIEYRYIHVFLN